MRVYSINMKRKMLECLRNMNEGNKKGKLILCVIIFALLWGMFPSAKLTSAKIKNIGYLGGSESPKFQIKYKGNKLYLKGYVWKTKGVKNPKYPSGKKKTKITKTVKIGDNCKIVTSEGMEDTVFKFKKMKSYGFKENTWYSEPYLYVLVKGNNAVYLVFSA